MTSTIKEDQFLRLLEKHSGILYRICRIYLTDRQAKQDLLQEMVLQLWRSYDTFREESLFSTWMYRVALNTAISFYKKEQQRNELLNNLPGEEFIKPFEQEDKQEQLNILYKAMQELSRVEKALIFLYLEGLPGNQIAAHFDITPQHARVRINRTKQKLQQIIKYMGYEF